MGEASADVHAAYLIQALKKKDPQIDVCGVGGHWMGQQGFRTLVSVNELLVMGFVEVLTAFSRLNRVLKQVQQHIEKEKPEVVVCVDYPGFHFQLARRLLGRYRLVYYIPPKLWAWKAGRLAFLKKAFDRIICILPFEKEYYRSRGLEVEEVGHPLLEELPLHLSAQEARRQLGFEASSDLLCVWMPGSRPTEMRRHFDLGLATFQALQKRLLRPLHVLLPLAAPLQQQGWKEHWEEWKRKNRPSFSLTFVPTDQAGLCLKAAEVGLIKSGTSTLEAGLLGCPHVLFYKVHPVTAWVFRSIVRYRGWIGLVNRCLGRQVVQERFGREASADQLSSDLWALIQDEEQRASQMKIDFQALRGLFQVGIRTVPPSELAAGLILEVAKGFVK